MSNQKKASELARIGFDFWQKKQFEEAVPYYQQALALADSEYISTESYYAEFAGVLSALGRLDEAGVHFQQSLDLIRRQESDEFSAMVTVARYFLAENYLRRKLYALAIETVEPSLGGTNLQFILRLMKAFALQALGHDEPACAEAQYALVMAPDKWQDSVTQFIANKFKGDQHPGEWNFSDYTQESN